MRALLQSLEEPHTKPLGLLHTQEQALHRTLLDKWMECVPEEHLGSSSAYLFPFQGKEDFCWGTPATYKQEDQAVAAAAKAIPKGPLWLGQKKPKTSSHFEETLWCSAFPLACPCPWLVHNTWVHAGSSCLAVPGFGQGLPRNLHHKGPEKGEGC